jgi:hypothetical protein
MVPSNIKDMMSLTSNMMKTTGSALKQSSKCS